jgi:hypothetical protein
VKQQQKVGVLDAEVGAASECHAIASVGSGQATRLSSSGSWDSLPDSSA